MIDRVIDHLRVLVSHDTSDPPAVFNASHPLLAWVAQRLADAGCAVSIDDVGGGCVNVFATRGAPRVLWNCHLDTVPVDDKWTRDPFTLAVEGGRAIGRGTTDIKGAGACMLAAIETSDAPVAMLFTTDEEAGKGRCVEAFCASGAMAPACAVVAEPTSCRAVTAHRGFSSYELCFTGAAGHTSQSDTGGRSAIHAAIRWGQQALDLVEGGPLAEARFNIGIVRGGVASNVIASEACVRFGMRPTPELDAETCIAPLREAAERLNGEWRDRFVAPPLAKRPEAVAAVQAWGIERSAPVDYWTEAALFSKAGIPSVVLGPGDIAQAHAADEFVSIAQLEMCLTFLADLTARLRR